MASISATTSQPCKCCGATIAGFGCSGLTGTAQLVGVKEFAGFESSPIRVFKTFTLTGDGGFDRFGAWYRLAAEQSGFYADCDNIRSAPTQEAKTREQRLNGGPEGTLVYNAVSGGFSVGPFSGYLDNTTRINDICGTSWIGSSNTLAQADSLLYHTGSSCTSAYSDPDPQIFAQLSNEDTIHIALANAVCRGYSAPSSHGDCCAYTSAFNTNASFMFNAPLSGNVYLEFTAQSLVIKFALAGHTVGGSVTIEMTFATYNLTTGASTGGFTDSITYVAPANFFYANYEVPMPAVNQKVCFLSATLTNTTGTSVTLTPNGDEYDFILP